MRTLVLLIALAPTVAAAQPQMSAEECAAGFPARLADARAAITQFDRYTHVMAWYEAHCRPMTEPERERRRTTDPDAFICDTRRGRPPELSPDFVTQPVPESPAAYQEMHAQSLACGRHDIRERIFLYLGSATPLMKLSILCWQSAEATCARSREARERFVRESRAALAREN